VTGSTANAIQPGAYHDVAQGESAESIAAAVGHLVDTVWNAPENASLKSLRKDPHVLMPGDRIFVPPLQPKTFQVRAGAAKRFQVTRPPSRLRLRLLKDGNPRANEPFVLTVDGVEDRGTTDGDGRIDRPLPARAERATLAVGEGEARVEYRLQLRALDPATETSGLQARLANLGFDVGPVDGEIGARTRAALAAFQQEQGLQVTGDPDDATRDRLQQQHGS
jgi:N-acetylmuramoyl-L-alanine amidase